jgi:hypothetical protein
MLRPFGLEVFFTSARKAVLYWSLILLILLILDSGFWWSCWSLILLILDSGFWWSCWSLILLILDSGFWWSSCVRGCVLVGCCLWLFYGCFITVLSLFYDCCIVVFTSVPLRVCSWLLRLACVRACVRAEWFHQMKRGGYLPPPNCLTCLSTLSGSSSGLPVYPRKANQTLGTCLLIASKMIVLLLVFCASASDSKLINVFSSILTVTSLFLDCFFIVQN